jgi:hypothetical protein
MSWTTLASGLLLALLVVAGAAGLATLGGEECGAAAVVEGTSSRWELALWPPGGECVYSLPNGETLTRAASSTTWFVVLVAFGLGVAAWAAPRWPAVSRPARVAALTMIAICIAGIGALLGGFQLAFVLGFALGVPAALVAGRGGPAVADAVTVGVALTIAAMLLLLGLGVEAFLIALAVVTLAAALSPPGKLRAWSGSHGAM